MYDFKSRVRYSEVNSERQLTLPALIDYLQNCCTFQSEDMNIGVEYLEQHHAAWVLSSWEIVMNRYPKLAEHITVSTWPYSFKGFYGYRNFTIKDEEGQSQQIINVFSTSDYVKEAKKILDCQKAYHDFISDDFCNNIIGLIKEKRKYYVGPGNEKSRTDYGIYRTDGTTLENLFGILVGKCTFYPEQYRSSKASYTSQEFNFLNDLNNLTVPTETKKLSLEQKESLVEYAKNSTTLGAGDRKSVV